MSKYWVFELSKESQDLFRSLAEEVEEFTEEDIQNGLDSKIGDLDDAAYTLGFRICNNRDCQEFSDEGYHTDDDLTFCSRQCAEKVIVDLEEEDYGDYIYYTFWWD